MAKLRIVVTFSYDVRLYKIQCWDCLYYKEVDIYHVGFYTKTDQNKVVNSFNLCITVNTCSKIFINIIISPNFNHLTIIRGSEFSQTTSIFINIYSSNIPLSLKHSFVINIMLKFCFLSNLHASVVHMNL